MPQSLQNETKWLACVCLTSTLKVSLLRCCSFFAAVAHRPFARPVAASSASKDADIIIVAPPRPSMMPPPATGPASHRPPSRTSNVAELPPADFRMKADKSRKSFAFGPSRVPGGSLLEPADLAGTQLQGEFFRRSFSISHTS